MNPYEATRQLLFNLRLARSMFGHFSSAESEAKNELQIAFDCQRVPHELLEEVQNALLM